MRHNLTRGSRKVVSLQAYRVRPVLHIFHLLLFFDSFNDR